MNYPIKQALVEMDNAIQIDMDNNAFKFCVSAVAMRVAGYGLQLVISSGNDHPIAAKLKILLLLSMIL